MGLHKSTVWLQLHKGLHILWHPTKEHSRPFESAKLWKKCLTGLWHAVDSGGKKMPGIFIFVTTAVSRYVISSTFTGISKLLADMCPRYNEDKRLSENATSVQIRLETSSDSL